MSSPNEHSEEIIPTSGVNNNNRDVDKTLTGKWKSCAPKTWFYLCFVLVDTKLSEGKPLATSEKLNEGKPVHANHLTHPGKNLVFSLVSKCIIIWFSVAPHEGVVNKEEGIHVQVKNANQFAYKPFVPTNNTTSTSKGIAGTSSQCSEEANKWAAFKEGESKLRNARRKIAGLKKKAENADLSAWDTEKFGYYQKIVNDKQLSDFLTRCKQEKEEIAALRLLNASLNNCSVDDESIPDGKRKRSEDVAALNLGKKPKNLQGSQDKLRLYVLNENAPEFRISSEDWLKTESEFQMQYVLDDEAPVIECDGAGWSHGHKMIGCANVETAEWIRKTINSLPKDGNLSRKVIYASELDQFEIPRGWVWVPLPLTTEETFLKLIAKQNHGLPMTGWKVLRKFPYETEKNGQRYSLLLNRDSIKYLEGRNFSLNYSVSKVVINLFKRTQEDEGSSD